MVGIYEGNVSVLKIKLTLNADNTCTLVASGMIMTGTYTAGGDRITLNVSGPMASFAYDGTFKKDMLILDYSGMKVKMKKVG